MDSTASEYFSAVPDHRREKVELLHSLVLDLFPEATVDMKYKMPTYSLGDGWVAIANQKNYVSLYTCSPAHLARFKETHPTIKTGKGCINFRDRDSIPSSAVREVIEHAIRNPKGDRN